MSDLTPGALSGFGRRSAARWRAAVARAIGPPRVWILSLALIAASALLYLGAVGPQPPIRRPFDLPWWSIAVGYAVAEVLVVHLQFRRQTHSFSLSEVPLAIGLYFLAPVDLLLALLTGSGAALALHRRQPLVKLVFNLANLAFVTQLAILLFRSLADHDNPLGPMGWLGAFGGAIVADLLSLLMIGVAISLATGRRPEMLRLLSSGTVASFFNTCLALVTVTLLWVKADAAWMPGVLAALMFGAYRIYGSLRKQHDSLELLYDTTRRFQQVTDLDGLVAALLSQAREMFKSERAEVLFLPNGPEPAVRIALGPGDSTVTDVLPSLDPREGVWARVAAEGRGACFPRPIATERLREYFDRQGIRDAIVAPLFGGDTVVGTLLVANRMSDVSSYGPEDVPLLETIANHASASLENARLIGRLKRNADEQRHQALHDALTGLPNRTYFGQEVERAIGDARHGAFAVLVMDLDQFKEVNDTLGHHNGDLLIRAVADRLRGIVRPGDVVSRLGGDEFGILLREAAAPETAQQLAERVLASLAAPFVVQELALEMSASIGIALYPLHGRDVETILQRADVAMYEAKGNFRGHEIYSPDQDSYSPGRLLLVGELRGAIEHGELGVAFQPKAALGDGQIVGAEALIRWRHPRRGDVPPDEFMPIAEHTGLLRPLTLYVLTAALEQCGRWRAAGHELSVSVNLSVRNLLDVELPDQIAHLLARLGLPAAALQLEITESALIADPNRTLGVLRRLHDLGVGVGIDDYGTGYSSLAYIRRMPINELKIDKSFVLGMAADANDELIVRSTIDLAHNLGLRVVAEGVETRGAWDRLAELGCDIAQGYFIGRPMDADAFLSLVRSAAASPGPGASTANRVGGRLGLILAPQRLRFETDDSPIVADSTAREVQAGGRRVRRRDMAGGIRVVGAGG